MRLPSPKQLRMVTKQQTRGTGARGNSSFGWFCSGAYGTTVWMGKLSSIRPLKPRLGPETRFAYSSAVSRSPNSERASKELKHGTHN